MAVRVEGSPPVLKAMNQSEKCRKHPSCQPCPATRISVDLPSYWPSYIPLSYWPTAVLMGPIATTGAAMGRRFPLVDERTRPAMATVDSIPAVGDPVWVKRGNPAVGWLVAWLAGWLRLVG